MALAYHKLTEQEDQMRNVLPKGEYPFHIKTIEQKPTKSKANTMLEVELSVLDNNGRSVTVKDWVVIDMEQMAWKFRHLAATCGLMDSYEADTLETYHFLGKHGVVKLSIREYEQDGEIRKANAVVDYVKPGQAKGNMDSQKNDNDFIDDDIPNL